MGAAMARALFCTSSARVALLNIGVEEVKGLEEIKAAPPAQGHAAAHRVLRLVEGDEIGHGAADVVVTDGFTCSAMGPVFACFP